MPNSKFHIGALLCIMLLGTTGNCTIIRIYFKHNTHDKVYFLVMLLAMVDLVAGFFPFIFDGLLKNYIHADDATEESIQFVHVRIVRFFILNNLSILGTMAVDRGLAVFRPFKYKLMKPKIHNSAILLLLVSAVETLISSLFYPRHVHAGMIFVGAAFCVGVIISCIYLLIICKLYRERRRVHASIAMYNSRSVQTAWTTQESSSNNRERFVSFFTYINYIVSNF